MYEWVVNNNSCYREKEEGPKSVQGFSSTKVFDVIAETISRDNEGKSHAAEVWR